MNNSTSPTPEQGIPEDELARIKKDANYVPARTTWGEKKSYIEGATAEYLRAARPSQTKPSPSLRWKEVIEKRIAYLKEAERNAIIDIDGVPVGSHARTVSWNFIHELGHRKNELQDILKQASESPSPDPNLSSFQGTAPGESNLTRQQINDAHNAYIEYRHSVDKPVSYVEWFDKNYPSPTPPTEAGGER